MLLGSCFKYYTLYKVFSHTDILFFEFSLGKVYLFIYFYLLKTEKLPFGKAGKMWISNYDIRLDSRDGYCPFDSLCGLLTVFGNSGWGISLLQPTF